MADQLSSFRVFDVDVSAARQPSRLRRKTLFLQELSSEADNLAEFLFYLSANDDTRQNLVADARTVLPQLDDIEFARVGGSADQVTVILRERGLRRPTPSPTPSTEPFVCSASSPCCTTRTRRPSRAWRRSTTDSTRRPWN